MQHEFRRALDAARHYRRMGLVPLPSQMGRKRPDMPNYSQFRTEKVPPEVYSDDCWHTTNIQLLCGAGTPGLTKIIVIDLDGPDARDAWRRMCQIHGGRAGSGGTWIATTGGGGVHIYYRLDPEVEWCASRLLWGLYDPLGGPDCQGGWLKHSEVRFLGDGALAVAPPSRHVKTGREYIWRGKHNPGVYALPAVAPAWLLAHPGVSTPDLRSRFGVAPKAPRRPQVAPGRTREEILGRIPPDAKATLASLWGLRFARGANPGQVWMSCHAFDREDRTPSGQFCPESGVYMDFVGGPILSFFDLAAALGAYPDWQTAKDALALQF